MKTKYKNIEFTLQYYQYADTSTVASMVVIDHEKGNHTYYTLKLTDTQRHDIWYLAATKGRKVAIDEIKRIYRQRAKERNEYLLYPFMLEGRTEHIYTKGSYIKSTASLQDRLRLAKRQKEDFEHDKWLFTEPASTEGTMEVIDGKLKMVKKEERISTRKILMDSQFCQRVYDASIWSEIRKQSEEHKQKEQKRIKGIQKCFENLKYNIEQEKERIANGIPKTWQIENWLEICENRLEEYRQAGWEVV